ncbi:MAG TPA: thioredoxin family protein [Acidobacteriaceae bacterium]|jgi:thiol:disulfide interchange protein
MQQRFTATFHAFKRAAVLCVALSVVLCAALSLAAHSAFAQGRVIYPDPSVAKTEIHEALQRAKAQHKRVILDFGGNWCGDCQVLDIYFHDAENKALLEENFELVDVNVGRYDANLDIAGQYGIPLERGVPALVVLSPEGRVLLAQTHGEFESMRRLQSSDLTKFLNDWKPTRHSARGGR